MGNYGGNFGEREFGFVITFNKGIVKRKFSKDKNSRWKFTVKAKFFKSRIKSL